ncbi:MAG: MFS transporter, partial [Bradyrhizobium sp.]|nr:MFS transporter [Bradyrhizobium sp.]
ALGLGTTFPVCVVSVQNSVARPQVGTITGALNFFRSLMSSFTVAAFAAILLIALGADIPLAGEHHVAGGIPAIPAEDMRHAFRYVFGAATALMTGAALCLIAMEERPLAGPTVTKHVEMAE